MALLNWCSWAWRFYRLGSCDFDRWKPSTERSIAVGPTWPDNKDSLGNFCIPSAGSPMIGCGLIDCHVAAYVFSNKEGRVYSAIGVIATECIRCRELVHSVIAMCSGNETSRSDKNQFRQYEAKSV